MYRVIIIVNKIPIRTARRYTAYIPQDNFLFSDTFANNISFSMDGVGDETIAAAARLADVHDNILGFSDGYHRESGQEFLHYYI